MLRLVTSTSAAARLQAATRFLEHRPQADAVLIVAASRGAADDVARAVGRRRGATFGLARFSVVELAARIAFIELASAGRAPVSEAGAQAMAARAVFDADAAGELAYFGPVATLPGFSRALARTLHELRLARVGVNRFASQDADSSPLSGRGLLSGGAGPALADLGRLLVRVEAQLDEAAVNDRTALFLAASAACSKDSAWTGLPLVLVDATADSNAERAFLAALIARAPEVLATLPEGDEPATHWFMSLGAALSVAPDPADPASDLAHLRRYVFADRPPVRERAGDVRLFSAPGEGREMVEVVRRILAEAERGVPFDEMAVFVRTPQQYLGLVEHACARGGVPVYFDRGTRRPDPAGRAFTALLACAAEGLSARRFDEYLSLSQVPQVAPGPDSAPVLGTPPSDEASRELVAGEGPPDDSDTVVPEAPDQDSDEEAVVAGTLRSPWKWEELIVESAVVGGRTRAEGKARWRRRLDGLAADYRFRIAELSREEPESPRIARHRRDLRNLAHLRAFALPIIDAMADWPDRATWGQWLDLFAALTVQGLRRPDRVLRILADVRPMADVGPVSLEQACDSLHDRLVVLDWEPPARRYGRVFVGTPHQARGRAFRVVFVPGLAERVVPQRPREDPLLLDERRRDLDPSLVRQDDRAAAERLLLRIAIGAATERLYVSYPRMDVAETRARVPSFYALDVVRAMTGRVPDHRVLAAEAADEAGASLAWPAPSDPDSAIDDLEHDLAVLKPLLESRDKSAVKGRAHYLLDLNQALRRSVISRWARDRASWSSSDGLVRVARETASAFAAHRLSKRAYSLSALQRYSICPYQFLLATIHRLEPWDEPEPLMRMDPLTRGSLFHAVQAAFYRALERQGVQLGPASLTLAVTILEGVLQSVAARYAEDLAPAVDRVWQDEIAEIARDLGIWAQKVASGEEWVPQYFEFSFGLHDEGRDPHSVPEPVVLDGGFVLRGSVDLIERHSDLDVLRVTDHKTGKDRSTQGLVVGGGATLQPVLYSVAVERALGKKVTAGRLYYCTTAGGFAEHTIELNDYTRSQGLQVLSIVDRAVEQGFLVAAPQDRACTWCDFRPVCGPREQERVQRKAQDRLADLHALRSMR